MKTVRNVYESMCNKEVLELAMKNASKGKKKYYHVRKILKEKDKNIDILYNLLTKGEFKPSLYSRKVIKTYEKEREIFKLPFFPDRVLQHAIAIVMLKRWTKTLSDDTYASWPKRGINSKTLKYNLNYKIKRAINSYPQKTEVYCLKMDIKKCYPSIDNETLKKVNKKYCGDKRLLFLFNKIIDNTKGLPIGNYISQLWVNIYLSSLDRFIKEELKAKYYFRYMDDIVVLSDDKKELHEFQYRIMNFVFYNLKVEINNKRQIFKIGRTKIERGIDFVGYVYRRNFTLVRKRTKKSFIKKLNNPKSLVSYLGILKYCDSKNLLNKYINNKNKINIKDMGSLNSLKIKKVKRPFEGDKVKIEAVIDKPITILDFAVLNSSKKEGTKYCKMQIEFEGKKRFLGGGYQFLCEVLEQLNKNDCPIDTIIKYKRGYYFEGTLADED